MNLILIGGRSIKPVPISNPPLFPLPTTRPVQLIINSDTAAAVAIPLFVGSAMSMCACVCVCSSVCCRRFFSYLFSVLCAMHSFAVPASLLFRYYRHPGAFCKCVCLSFSSFIFMSLFFFFCCLSARKALCHHCALCSS